METNMKFEEYTRLLLLATLSLSTHLNAQHSSVNYREDRVPAYNLPNPLINEDGHPVENAKSWRDTRRPEILELFRTHMYGRSPESPSEMSFQVTSVDSQALGGVAIRKEVSIHFTKNRSAPRMDLLIYIPVSSSAPVPAFLGLNFNGNHSVHPDPWITLPTSWMRPSEDNTIVSYNRATEKGRGRSSSRWPVQRILDRGYGLVTAYYGDLDPDYHDGFQNGLHPLFYQPGQTLPAADEWGSISSWAWGLSRALDYLETEPWIDQEKVAVLGHSRLGKTALWAGAQDQRFAFFYHARLEFCLERQSRE